ncbi:hypothetical protein NQ315_007136 [Exocentrus adspersus]|uniref:Luciferin 4-monooxygenase n=1 Tax=Exocentrus adspersus TaxID=1586481 RepID=A0AAV8WCD6_9CUCU|nr:hypothetical protein NQ315_007136 [Exocentrus adspersus]
MNSSNLVWGAPDDTKLENTTPGKLIYESLQKKTQSEIILVDTHTGEEVSRKKFLSSVTKLTEILRKLGISKEETIGIATPNTWRFLVPAVASLLIGSTCTSMNPSAHKDDIKHYLNLSKPKILFVSCSVLDKVRELKPGLGFLKYLVILDGGNAKDGELIFDELMSRELECKTLEINADCSVNALILYSSGTTGLSKGVVLTQTNMLNCMKYCRHPNFVDVHENTIMLGILPQFHVFGLMLSLQCIWTAKKTVYMQKFNPENFLKAIQSHKVTFLPLVPPILIFLAKSPLVDNYDISSISNVLCGAAPLGREMEVAAFERLKVKIRQTYGLSETTGAVAIISPSCSKPGSVGRVVLGHHAKIIDTKTGKILGRNENGEICFKGPCVMKGYVNNVEETNKTLDQDGYLHTGDVGYFDDEGYLYVLDRIKELIKYKAFQVPPAQLEDILTKHPGVKDAAVLGKPDERSGELPTAFIVRHPNVQVTEQELIDYVAERVSVEKQLHGGVIFKDELPRTTSGKVLKKELKKLL